MAEEMSLNEKCKLAVWMEQFQSAEIVQLRYKKEFDKTTPSLQCIEEIHNLFMTTGSVVDYMGGHMQDKDSEKDQKQKVRFRVNSASKEKILDNVNRVWNEEKEGTDGMKESFVEEDDEIEEEIDLYLTDETEGEKDNNFVSILNEEIAVGDQDYAEISVNECEDGLEDSLNSKKETFFCVNCGYKTYDKVMFEAHQKAHSVKDFFRCTSCTFTSNSTNLFRSHKKSCAGNNNNNMNNTRSIGNKLNLVTDPNCHTCDQCGKAYSSSASLKMHQAYHSKLRPFACDKCDYRFLSETSLKKHLLTHDKIKHLECPHCSFKCNMSGNMIIHARTHTGEKPYKCAECSYRTGNPSVFKRHMAAHRNEITYRCRQCNYKTHKSTLLANHEKSHSSGLQFQCHICQKALRNSYALRYHMTKQHSEQEVLECPFCDFCQRDKALLKIHIRRHTGEKPYGCPEKNCTYRAMRSQDMKKHMSKVH